LRVNGGGRRQDEHKGNDYSTFHRQHHSQLGGMAVERV
jgi:hypothetical protein